MFLSIYQTGLLYYLLGASLAWAWARRARVPALPLAWLVFVLGYLTFGSASLTSYVPLAKQPRYLEAVTVPAVLLTAGGISQLLAKGAPSARTVAGVGLAAYGVVGLFCAQITSAMERWRFEPVREAYELLEANHLAPAYAPLRLTNGFFQLSGTRRSVDESAAEACMPTPEGVLSVWAAPDGPGRKRPPAPDVRCNGWTLWRTVEVTPPPLLARTLSSLHAGLDHAPVPAPLTRKIRSTIEDQAGARTVRIFVPESGGSR